MTATVALQALGKGCRWASGLDKNTAETQPCLDSRLWVPQELPGSREHQYRVGVAAQTEPQNPGLPLSPQPSPVGSASPVPSDANPVGRQRERQLWQRQSPACKNVNYWVARRRTQRSNRSIPDKIEAFHKHTFG